MSKYSCSGLCYGGECENTVGSFSCQCPEGSVMNDKQECVDLDECASGQDTCHRGRCINTDPGEIIISQVLQSFCILFYNSIGYYCVCDPNFIPTQDRMGCLDGRQEQ